METIFSLACISIVIWILKKVREMYFPLPHHDDEAHTDFDFEQVRELHQAMGKTINELESIEQLLTELELTEPEVREKPLSMSWSDAVSGQQKKFDFWMDGRKSTRLMIETIYEERDRLRSSLSSQIDELNQLNVTKSVTKTVTKTTIEQNRRGVNAS